MNLAPSAHVCCKFISIRKPADAVAPAGFFEGKMKKKEAIGGSSYMLSCMNSAIPVPAPEDSHALVTTEEDAQEPDTGDREESSQPSEETSDYEVQSEEKAVGGIPVSHLAMFGGGMILAVGTPVGMHIAKRRRQYDEADEDPDEEDY